jgi:hypothetical protein
MSAAMTFCDASVDVLGHDAWPALSVCFDARLEGLTLDPAMLQRRYKCFGAKVESRSISF